MYGETVVFIGQSIPQGYILDCYKDYGAIGDGSILNFSGFWFKFSIREANNDYLRGKGGQG